MGKATMAEWQLLWIAIIAIIDRCIARRLHRIHCRK